jgi:hypothetical protein
MCLTLGVIGSTRRAAVQLYVLSLVDHAHTATAQLLNDAVVRDGLAYQE